ncbi:MAG: transketolase [Chitinispirillaceae bacterium]
MDTTVFLRSKAVQLSKQVIKMTTSADSGHPSSALSISHIVTALMYKIMRFDPRNPWNRGNDRLILSEGHAVPIVYAAYADLNGAYGFSPEDKHILSTEDLDKFRQIDSPLDGHPNPSAGFPFFECATGSLGQGLSCACGSALGSRLDAIENNYYVIIGDGESREGQVWEACDFLIDYHLDNVIPLFNCNGLGQSDTVSPQQSAQRIEAKLKAFGFVVLTIDGHNPEEIIKSFQQAKQATSPHALVAQTQKGWGVRELYKTNSHGKPLKERYLSDALSGLDEHVIASSSPREQISPSKPPLVTVPRRLPGRLNDPDFSKILKGTSSEVKLEKKLLSTRRAYGLALKELAEVDERIVLLDGDVKNSTFSEYMADAFPEKFFESKIAEQNMISAAAGLASSGRIPFVSTFAKFLVRGYDQLELAIISDANIKLVGSHSGINIGPDGPSQMGMSDLAFMKAYSSAKHKFSNRPLVTIFNPSCAVAAFKCVQLMADIPGACYMRTIRGDTPILYNSSETFEPGGFKVLREGQDVAIITSGYMVHVCLKLASQLAEKGLEASVIDCYSLPVAGTQLRETISDCRSAATVEDNLGNGLGSEIASVMLSGAPLGIPLRQYHAKRLPKSGLTADDVFEYTGLNLANEWVF